jgi:hypothetical protein
MNGRGARRVDSGQAVPDELFGGKQNKSQRDATK